jgi:hypothetical protein
MTKKVLKLSISRLLIEHHEKRFRSSLPTLDRIDKAKTPSHATVPLNIVTSENLRYLFPLFFFLTKKSEGRQKNQC